MVSKFNFVEGLPVIPNLNTMNMNGKRFYVLPDGNFAPSVTTMLGHFEKAGINRWRKKVGQEEADKILKYTSERGEKFHSSVENYFKTGECENISPLVKKELDRVNNIHYIETCLYSQKFTLAGRCDLIAEFDGVLSVIDFKTSLKVKEEKWIQKYFEQGTSYGLMYEELTGRCIDQVVIIIDNDVNPEPQIFVKKKVDYIDSLMAKHTQYMTQLW